MKHIYLFLFLSFIIVYNSYAQSEMEAYQLYQSAEKFMRLKKYHEASVFFDKAIVKDPTNHAILYERGRCYIKLKNFDKASYSFQRVIELREDYTNAHLLLGYLHHAKNRLDDAVKDYSLAYKYEEKAARRFIIKLVIINLLDKQGKMRDAEHHLAEAKAFGIENENYLYFQAKHKNLHGRYKEAKEYLVKTIAKIENLHPDSVAVEMGEKLFQQTYNISAIPENNVHSPESTQAKMEIRPNPANNKKNKTPVAKLARFYYEMYFTLYKLHQYEYAENIYEKAAFEPYKSRMAPLHESYIYNIAYAYYQIHELERSKDVLDEILRQNPNHNGANALAKKITDSQEDKTVVIAQMEAALKGTKMLKSLEKMENDMLKIYLDAGQYDKLIELADKMLATKPDHHQAMFYKALILSRNPDKQEDAFEMFDKLLHLSDISKKELAKYHFALGIFAYRVESYKKAGLSYKACNYMYFKSAAHRELQKILPSDMED